MGDWSLETSSATLRVMESNLAKQMEQAMTEAMRKLSPEQRLNAFLAHCQLMIELCRAAQQPVSAKPEAS